MRRTVRVLSETSPTARLGTTISALPPEVQRRLVDVVGRTDLSLAAGSWREGDAGCLVANVVAAMEPVRAAAAVDPARTLDLRVLDLVPQMSSRDLNHLIVAWDEAAVAARATDDGALRELLRGALVHAGVMADDVPATAPPDGARVLEGARRS